MPETAFLISAFAALFVVIDPIGLTPIFVALTRGMSRARRRAIGLRACAVALFVLLLFTTFGEAVLGFIGISMPAFRVAGGILLFLTALDMLFERRQKRRKTTAGEDDAPHDDDDDDEDPSVFPLAIPLIAGPGAIATMILLVGGTSDVTGFAAVIGVLVVVLSIVFLLFLAADPLERLLGPIAINVVTRLLGMLLAALSVQFVLDGLRDFGMAGCHRALQSSRAPTRRLPHGWRGLRPHRPNGQTPHFVEGIGWSVHNGSHQPHLPERREIHRCAGRCRGGCDPMRRSPA